MMCINKVSSTIERAACPLTFKDILNYSSYFFFCLSFPCNSLVYSTQSRYSFSNFVFFFFFSSSSSLESFKNGRRWWWWWWWYCPIVSGLYGGAIRVSCCCPARSFKSLFSSSYWMFCFFLPRHPTSHLLMALLIIFHLIFKTHQMRR